ncbi:hypothetical protein GCM10010294_26250 [Streptomyces griseoloalbus]|nr:hypothetical protein GCM10010294_26250 [Streptomyces griseoloalbus]
MFGFHQTHKSRPFRRSRVVGDGPVEGGWWGTGVGTVAGAGDRPVLSPVAIITAASWARTLTDDMTHPHP